jgi:NADH-quinone oxidoreductase subunit H
MLLLMIGAAHLSVAAWSLFTGWGTELPHIAVVVIGLITWGIKVVAICWLQLLIRWTLPRFRYDQLMSLGWKGLLPLSIVNIVVTAVVVYFMMGSDGEPAAMPPSNPLTVGAAVEDVR